MRSSIAASCVNTGSPTPPARSSAGAWAGTRIALGGVAHKPWRAMAAETALAAQGSGQDAADVELAPAKGYGHNDFKIALARRLIAAGPAAEAH